MCEAALQNVALTSQSVPEFRLVELETITVPVIFTMRSMKNRKGLVHHEK